MALFPLPPAAGHAIGQQQASCPAQPDPAEHPRRPDGPRIRPPATCGKRRLQIARARPTCSGTPLSLIVFDADVDSARCPGRRHADLPTTTRYDRTATSWTTTGLRPGRL